MFGVETPPLKLVFAVEGKRPDTNGTKSLTLPLLLRLLLPRTRNVARRRNNRGQI